MQIERLFSSISFRVALIFSGLLLASFLAAAAVTYVATQSAAMADARARILVEVGAVRHEAAAEGLSAAVAAVVARAEASGALRYRIVDAAGKTIAGDSRLTVGAPGWHRLNDMLDNEGPADHLLYAAPLPQGGELLVAENLEGAERVRDRIIQTLALVGVLAAAAGLIVGWLATRQVLARFDALSSVASHVSSGDFSVRAPQTRGMRDDLEAFTGVFNAMLDRIATLVANIRRVSTDIAHELRTPLAHLGQKLEKAREAQTLDDAKAALDEAQAGMDRVLATFSAVLRLSEIEAGRLRERFAPVDLSALGDRVADAYGPDVEASGRKLIPTISPGAIVNGDDDLLAQAISNLIENAMRHTPLGCTIRLSVRRDRSRCLMVVEDNGPGIPSDARDKALEPFARLDASRNRPGAGLGLSIANAIARLHGADLFLEDAGPGLRIGMALPAVTSAS